MNFLLELVKWQEDSGWKKNLPSYLISDWMLSYGMPETFGVTLYLVNDDDNVSTLDLVKFWDNRATHYFWWRERSFDGSPSINKGETYKSIFTFLTEKERESFIDTLDSFPMERWHNEEFHI